MDDRKIAFIICRTDKRYYEECVKYLEDLTVPEGYCTDVLSVVDVASTAAVSYTHLTLPTKA